MSVSSHLTPEPERRLWAILDFLRAGVAAADWQLLALTGFAALELLAARPGEPFVAATLGLAVLFGLGAFIARPRLPGDGAALDPARGRQSVDDSFITAEDLAKYAHGELILKMDRYLGGGITATQYHEDLVAEIGANARLAVRKRRMLAILCGLVLLGQAALLGRLL
ncbi:MAG: hypothetical protein SF051_09865 [Elusimicrobiota bacterium]|nr:hypothetical protein [Elusimicrobiota bacterium]